MIAGGCIIEIATLARRVVELVEDKQARDIVLLDIRTLTTIADYFVICSADNDRQVQAIVDHLDEAVQKEFDCNPRVEGAPGTGWVVLDYHDIIVHVFRIDQRDYYRLEELWSTATPVLVIQ